MVAAHFNLTGQALCDKEQERADHGIMTHLAIPVNDNEKKKLLNYGQMPPVAGSVTVWEISCTMRDGVRAQPHTGPTMLVC